MYQTHFYLVVHVHRRSSGAFKQLFVHFAVVRPQGGIQHRVTDVKGIHQRDRFRAQLHLFGETKEEKDRRRKEEGKKI